MDPLSATERDFSAVQVVDVSRLKRWNEIPAANRPNAGDSHHEISPFPFESQLNEKIVLWVGDICTLNAQAIVNSTNEALNDTNALSSRIFKAAGPLLRAELQNIVKVCKTGDAKITKGYDLPARFVIHTVGPRYNVRYQTAAQSALYSCYRKTMQLVRENELQSVALSVINSVRRGYPPEEGAHIALRTVRRFLEKYGDTIETVVFAVEDEDVGIYETLMPLYFPRNRDEETVALHCLPADLGNEDGEPYVADRQIRIQDKPHQLHDVDFEENTELLVGPETLIQLGNSDFTKMMDDVDLTRPSQRNSLVEKNVVLEAQGMNRYERVLRRARTEDLSSISQIGCLYQSGFDKLGRPVIVLVGRWFKCNEIDLEKAMLYLVYLLYTVAKEDYVIIYFNTNTSSDNRPSMAWIREVYSVLEYKYRKNLKALYIVHPTWWTKLMTWGFTTFMAPVIKHKVHNLGGLEYLFAMMDMKQLQIPTFIREYDMSVNGIRYYDPVSEADEL